MTRKANTKTKIDPEIEIRVWMLRNKIKIARIAKASKKTSGAVTRFLSGDFKCPPIADFYKQNGCPGEFFDGNGVKAA